MSHYFKISTNSQIDGVLSNNPFIFYSLALTPISFSMYASTSSYYMGSNGLQLIRLSILYWEQTVV